MSDPATENVSADTPENVIFKNLPPGEIITGATDAEAARAAVPELGEQRHRTLQDSGIGDEGDTRQRPFEWSGAGLGLEKDSTRQALQKAATMQTDERKRKLGREYLGTADDDLAWRAADMAAQLGRKPTEAAYVKVGVADRDGTVYETPDDHHVYDANAVGNLRDVTRAQGNWRLAQEIEAQQLREEFAQRQTQQAEQSQIETSVSSPEPQPVQTPAPDQLAAERAQLQRTQQEAWALREHARLSGHEREALDAVQKWDRWGRAQADLQGQALANTVARAQRGDQKALARLRELNTAHNARNQWLQRYSAANEQRVTKELQIASYQQGQQQVAYDKAADIADNEFKSWIAREHPAYSSGKGLAALRAAAQKYVEEDLGLSKQEWQAHWRHTGYLRNLPAQKSIALAAMQKLGQSRMKELASHRAPVVQGHAPGAFQEARSDMADEISTLQRQLEAAPNQTQALRIARRLTAAKRAAGQLANSW